MANIGIRTGSGLVVLDVDVAKGGDDSLELLTEQGDLGETLQVKTGGGGYHWYYACNKPVRCSVSRLATGIDVRGEGGYVVAPPSTHASGEAYAWEGLIDAHSGEGSIADIPPWLLALATAGRSARSDTDPYRAQAFIASTRNNALTSMAGTIRRRGAGYDAILALLVAMNAKKCRPPLDEAEVARIARSVTKYEPSDPLLGTVEHGGSTDGDDSWRKALVQNKDGSVAKTAGNAALLIAHSNGWDGCLANNTFENEAEWIRRPPHIPGAEMLTPHLGPIAEIDTVYVQQWIAGAHKCTIGRDSLWQSIRSVASSRDTHPVREWIDTLEWDGKKRVGRWLNLYLGSEDSKYTRSIGKAWLISAIARVMRPGCQADHVLVLEGAQGTRKSTAMRVLFGDRWFLDCLPDIRHKDALMVMRGKWGIEVAELDSFRGADETRIKSFITQRVDEYRPSHERQVVRYPRQCVIVGTTNEENWLTDSTGGRRFWPVKVGNVDHKKLAKDRAQIWAEAASEYNSGSIWWPRGELVELAKKQQSERHSHDVWQDLIARVGASTIDADYIYRTILGIEAGRITKADQVRVGAAMRKLGYSKARRRRDGVRITTYEKQNDNR